ncbi:tRNA threonylcarbamoyladenosine biosynthesis protein TsaB [Campylobacter sp. 2018MI35]|uniref:tRNA threonylcarbamoyladenosine biosynthesis protein TsaB n=1 Tax=Campylobacter sp. 2018MI34 TaxID=2800582 RepID=UPI001904C372|nr:tRNA threonylcarbamoyladenosine biosynthesis protein TsaB [Campylobacter sp. 2018MI34]MBK1992215.1 tRNA threonylcarbamoyladenosine biosynthesis protein TsaB [Campylobacter sp. 2018MI34]
MLGIYKENILIKKYTSDEKASEFLPKILNSLLKEFKISRLIYANGPGSYMSIKISYMSLKTLSIVKNIPLYSISAFELNDFKPIKANKDFCFVFKEGEIILEKNIPGDFFLPLNLDKININNNNLPFYFLDVI